MIRLKASSEQFLSPSNTLSTLGLWLHFWPPLESRQSRAKKEIIIALLFLLSSYSIFLVLCPNWSFGFPSWLPWFLHLYPHLAQIRCWPFDFAAIITRLPLALFLPPTSYGSIFSWCLIWVHWQAVDLYVWEHEEISIWIWRNLDSIWW